MNAPWYTDAACKDMPLHVFFPEGASANMYDQAAAVCAGCPVIDACRQAVIAEERHLPGRHHLHGYRAGMTPRQRWAYLQPHHILLCLRCYDQPRTSPSARYCADCSPAARAESTSRYEKETRRWQLRDLDTERARDAARRTRHRKEQAA